MKDWIVTEFWVEVHPASGIAIPHSRHYGPFTRTEAIAYAAKRDDKAYGRECYGVWSSQLLKAED